MDLIEGVALWLVFMLLLASGPLFFRAICYKFLKLLYTEDELYAVPHSRMIKECAALNLCPPLNYSAEQRKKWEALWWKYLAAAFVAAGLAGSMLYLFS
jgi:hypothetical protein